MSRFGTMANQLYSGARSFDFVGRRRTWYAISGVLVAVAIVALLVRGLVLGIEFKGGAEFVVPTTVTSQTVPNAREAAAGAGIEGAIVTTRGEDRVAIQTPPLESDEVLDFTTDLAKTFDTGVDTIAVKSVGPSWGADITRQAILGLVVFLIGVVIFLALYFDWRMAAAAIVALVHDVLLTVGFYALVGIEVTPASVIGFLTILGYSLYDTVVVFDKVRENTSVAFRQNRATYGELANLAVNQTLVRSLNTSIVALLPVGAILFVGVGVLQAGTLKDLAVALFVGIAVGTYSSIFVATPFLVQLEGGRPEVKALAKRVAARRGQPLEAAVAPSTEPGPTGGTASRHAGATAAATRRPRSTTALADSSEDEPPDTGPTRPTPRTGPRNQPRRQPRSKR